VSIHNLADDDLSVLLGRLKALTEGPGWPEFQGLVAQEVANCLDLLKAPPKSGDAADTYALRHADTAGYLRGLRFAQEQPHKILQRAETVLQQRQQAAELAARIKEPEHG
jgi:hypothetical protein